VDLKGSPGQAKGADWEESKAPPNRAECLSGSTSRILLLRDLSLGLSQPLQSCLAPTGVLAIWPRAQSAAQLTPGYADYRIR